MKNFLFFLYIICVFGTFQYTPLAFASNIYLSVVTVVGFGNFLYRRLFIKYGIVRWMVLIVFGLILMSVIASKNSYGQPVLSGILGVASFFYVFGPFAFWGQIKSGTIASPKVWKFIKIMIWINASYLFIFSILGLSYTFISPFSGNSLVIQAGKIAKGFVFLGFIYYVLLAIHRRKGWYFFLAILLFSITQIHDLQRGQLVIWCLILLLIVLTYRKTLAIKKVFLLLPFIALCGAWILMANSQVITTLSDKFQGVFELLEGKDRNISDPSVSIRVYETNYAITKFAEHPIFGNGNLRSSFKKEILPDLYFYPADVGIFGIMFLYGLIGIIVYIFIILFIIKLWKQADKKNIIEMTFVFYLVFNVIFTLGYGSVFSKPDTFVFFILLVLFMGEGISPLANKKLIKL